MLICPGGGYWNLYWQLEGEEVAAWLNSLGITGIILKYRVPRRPDEPKGDRPVDRCRMHNEPISLVRSKSRRVGYPSAENWHVGFSAGGHLAIGHGDQL